MNFVHRFKKSIHESFSKSLRLVVSRSPRHYRLVRDVTVLGNLRVASRRRHARKNTQMATNTADLRAEIIRGRSLLDNPKSLRSTLSFSLTHSFMHAFSLTFSRSLLQAFFDYSRIFGKFSLVPAARNSESTVESFLLFSLSLFLSHILSLSFSQSFSRFLFRTASLSLSLSISGSLARSLFFSLPVRNYSTSSSSDHVPLSLPSSPSTVNRRQSTCVSRPKTRVLRIILG